MMKKQTILITGGTGYLGSHLLKALVDGGHRIILLKRSFSKLFRIQEYLNEIVVYDIDKQSCEQAFIDNKLEIILHCATNYGRRNTDPLQIIDANLLFPLRLLEFANRYRVPCFINTDTVLDTRVSRYAMSKNQFREWLTYYQDSLTCINVALEHFYGPADDPTKFVSFIVYNLLNKVPVIDLTAGEQQRDFIYIDDVIEAFLKIIENSGKLSGFHKYEVGTHNSITIRALVELAKKITNNNFTKLNFGALPYRENETMQCIANITELQKLGWTPKISIEDGLKKMISSEISGRNF
jgi:nucleoside-diphosphate-sugar epimerase